MSFAFTYGPRVLFGAGRASELGAQLPAGRCLFVTDGQGLNITVQGYLGGLHFGLIACRELVPDVDKLTGYLVDELDLLLW